jgi:hypothetical protein
MHLNADERAYAAAPMGIEIISRTTCTHGQTTCVSRPLGRYTHQRSSYAQLCRSMPHSKIAGVEKHPCGSDTTSRRSIGACRCLDRRGASCLSRAWRRHVVGTLPSFAATLPLPHPCPSSSPFSIGHDGFFRLHRLEPSRPRDARRSIRRAPNAGAILARARISLCSSFYRSYRLSEPCCQRRASSPGRTQLATRPHHLRASL